MVTTTNLGVAEALELDRFTRQQKHLLALAQDKPTLLITDTNEIKDVRDWEHQYPESWLLIEITKDDFHGDCYGKLLAIAENAVEFKELKDHLRERGISTLTTYGISLETDDMPAIIPAFVVIDNWE